MQTDAPEDLRGLMFSIAYRMLGSVAEAEDVVQEAYLRMQAAEEPIRSPEAWATTVTTRLAIDALRSARAPARTLRGAVAARAAAHRRGR